MPRFAGGPAGYFGYDTVATSSRGWPIPPNRRTPGKHPDIMLLQVDELVIVDNLAGRTYLLVYADPSTPEAYAQPSAA